MNMSRLLILVGGLVIATAGCSDKQKEEAARLERELQESQAAADSAAAAESLAIEGDTISVDAGAVPEEAVEPLMPPRPVGEGFTVQVASCESREYADYLVDLYQKRGYDAFLTTISYEGQTYYRVRAGNFETLQEAKDLVAELQDKYSISTWIDKIEQ